jgi:hypothetical protein
MDPRSEKVSGKTDNPEETEEETSPTEEKKVYDGPERRAQGYLIAEIVEGPEPFDPTRTSDFPS